MELGPQFNQFTEMVPISSLAQIPGNRLRYDVSDLSKDIKDRGVQEAAIIRYHQPSRTVRLIEGNHRLAAAIQAGLTHVPATVLRSNYSEEGLPVRGVDPNPHGYVPGNLKPSDIMDWDDE